MAKKSYTYKENKTISKKISGLIFDGLCMDVVHEEWYCMKTTLIKAIQATLDNWQENCSS